MVAKVIVGLIILIVSIICTVLALYENTVNGESKKNRYMYGMYICVGSIVCGILITWFAFGW